MMVLLEERHQEMGRCLRRVLELRSQLVQWSLPLELQASKEPERVHEQERGQLLGLYPSPMFEVRCEEKLASLERSLGALSLT